MWSSRGKPTLLRGPPHLQETQWLPFWDPRTLLTVKGATLGGGLVPRDRPVDGGRGSRCSRGPACYLAPSHVSP